MKKVKRISLLVRGEGIVASLFKIREKKVRRAVESAKDFIQEKILEEETNKLKALEALGRDADSVEGCKKALNAYCDACEEIDAWHKKAEYMDMLEADLNVEVEESSPTVL